MKEDPVEQLVIYVGLVSVRGKLLLFEMSGWSECWPIMVVVNRLLTIAPAVSYAFVFVQKEQCIYR